MKGHNYTEVILSLVYAYLKYSGIQKQYGKTYDFVQYLPQPTTALPMLRQTIVIKGCFKETIKWLRSRLSVSFSLCLNVVIERLLVNETHHARTPQWLE